MGASHRRCLGEEALQVERRLGLADDVRLLVSRVAEAVAHSRTNDHGRIARAGDDLLAVSLERRLAALHLEALLGGGVVVGDADPAARIDEDVHLQDVPVHRIKAQPVVEDGILDQLVHAGTLSGRMQVAPSE